MDHLLTVEEVAVDRIERVDDRRAAADVVVAVVVVAVDVALGVPLAVAVGAVSWLIVTVMVYVPSSR